MNHTPRPRRKAGASQAVCVHEAAAAYTQEALDTLVEIMRDPKAIKATRIRAAMALLIWGHGAPTRAAKAEARKAVAKAFAAVPAKTIDAPPGETQEQWNARIEAMEAAARAAGGGDLDAPVLGAPVWRGRGRR